MAALFVLPLSAWFSQRDAQGFKAYPIAPEKYHF